MSSTVYTDGDTDEILEKVQLFFKELTGAKLSKSQIVKNAVEEYKDNLKERHEGF